MVNVISQKHSGGISSIFGKLEKYFLHICDLPSETNLIIGDIKFNLYHKIFFGSGGIRTHASEETGALNQRLRPLGHATYWNKLGQDRPIYERLRKSRVSTWMGDCHGQNLLSYKVLCVENI